MRIEDRCLQRTGRSLADFVEFHRSSYATVRSLASIIGVDHSTLIKALRRHGIRWNDRVTQQRLSYGISIDGITLTRRDHCRRLGVSEKAVYAQAVRLGLSFVDALTIVVAKKMRLADRDAIAGANHAK